MQDHLDALLEDTQRKVNQAQTLAELDSIRVSCLGKKGALTALLKQVSQLSADQKPLMGQAVNRAKRLVNSWIQEQDRRLKDLQVAHRLEQEAIDITLNGREIPQGSLHPVTLVWGNVIDIFTKMGFCVAHGPEIEDDYHNFTALNIPEHHPARAQVDTFYFEDGRCLRTHTSPVQIRVMEHHNPPIRIITPGRVFRCDSDQTHTPMFHQLEGLVIDRHCNFAQLKQLLHDFLKTFFDKSLELRFRPGYFPFTEPSAEMDIRWGDEWLEVLGCGMVHPNVLRQAGIDSDEYTGFAFGIGLDRLAMLRYQIDDLRILFQNDVRFLQQFR